MRILVTGGVRSGKSTHAEHLLRHAPHVRYVAPGPQRDDADWAARVAAHQARRPSHWETVETHRLPSALAGGGAVLVDCLGTWLTAIIDEAEAWEWPMAELEAFVRGETDRVVAAMGDHVVLVTNEVGLGVVPEHRSGRVFRDLLGMVNQRVGAECDEVRLVVAGRWLRLLNAD